MFSVNHFCACYIGRFQKMTCIRDRLNIGRTTAETTDAWDMTLSWLYSATYRTQVRRQSVLCRCSSMHYSEMWHVRRTYLCFIPSKFHFAKWMLGVLSVLKKLSRNSKMSTLLVSSTQSNDVFDRLRLQCIIWQKEVHHSPLNFWSFEKHCCEWSIIL